LGKTPVSGSSCLPVVEDGIWKLHSKDIIDKKDILLNGSRNFGLGEDPAFKIEELPSHVSEVEPNVLDLGMCEDEGTVCIVKYSLEENAVVQNCVKKQTVECETDKYKSCYKEQSDCGGKTGKPFRDSLINTSSTQRGKKISPLEKFRIHCDEHPSTNLRVTKGCAPTPTVLKDKSNIVTCTIAETSKYRYPQSNSVCTSSQNSNFKTPTNRVLGSVSGSIKVGFKTPYTSHKAHENSSMKVTPPLCKCGRRSKRRVAQTPGPNQGRSFFSCPQGSAGRNKGCGYFQWESAYMKNRSPQLFASPFAYAARTNRASSEFDSVTQKLNFSRPTGIDSARKSLGVRPGIHINNV
jgi:hypothetical protein